MKINSSWQGTQDTEITIRVLSSPGEPLLPGANWKVLSNGLDSEFRKAQKKVGQCCTHPSSFFSITTYCYLNTKLFFFATCQLSLQTVFSASSLRKRLERKVLLWLTVLHSPMHNTFVEEHLSD